VAAARVFQDVARLGFRNVQRGSKAERNAGTQTNQREERIDAGVHGEVEPERRRLIDTALQKHGGVHAHAIECEDQPHGTGNRRHQHALDE
jgi:hypothetical protein